MTWWERLAFQLGRAFMAGVFEWWKERGHKPEEAPNATDADAAARALELVARELRVQAGGPPRPQDPAQGR